MSINVTVNGNPVSIRRGRMVLSDLDQIKRNERDRRRKLRLEQVREQSKQISNRLLERAKNVTKAQLTQLEKDGRSELRQIHDQKIMDLQRKYQEDMEDIGRAHTSASFQPDAAVEALLEADRKKNRFLAVERGREAMQRLRDSNQTENENAVLHERKKLVRETENARAFMVANLPKNPCPRNESDQDSDLGSEETTRKSPKTRRDRNANKFQKSIPKVVVQSSDVQVVVSDPKAKRSEPQAGPSRVETRKMEGDSKRSNAPPSRTVTDISDFPCVVACCGSDDQEPRKSLPTFNFPSKADKVASYNPEDYKPDSSSSGSSSNSSTSLSDDSSYFSDGAVDTIVSKKTPRHKTSAASSKVQLYDHNTRQRNAYTKQFGLVEKIDMNGEPNAEELARAVIESENVDSRLAESRRRDAARRGNDAILRDKVRRDYKNLLENLDHFAREERKLKASQIHGPLVKDVHLNPVRRKELLAKRQRDMDHAFEMNLPDDSSPTTDDNLLRPAERVVTIAPIDEEENIRSTPSAVWRESPFFEPSSNIVEEVETDEKNNNEMSRNEQIFEMLCKVERQKRLLLKEFGADLPDEIFTASVKPLFGENISKKPSVNKKKVKRSSTPEIKVINMSSCDETDKMKSEKGKKKSSTPPKRIEIAVQTSRLDEKGVALDKSVQVELINGRRNSSSNTTSEETVGNKKSLNDSQRENNEEERNSGSSESVGTGIVIDIKKKRVTLTPRKKRSNLRISKGNFPRVVAKPRSVPGGKASTPVRRPSKSAPVSKQSTPRSNISDVQPIRITEKKVKIQLDKGGIKVKINPLVDSELLSIDQSTESSKSTPTEASREKISVSKYQGKIRHNSDTSTSYTSPPPPTPASYRSVRNNSTPILEILESSEGGKSKLKKRDISPVSSPGTPSPRIMNLPTNTPHSRQINRVLEYFDSTVSQSTDNTMSLSLPGQQSTPNEVPGYTSRKRDVYDHSDKSSEICLCRNPLCKLIHLNMRDVDNQTLQNYPEILKKYQDLQSMCTDRIASLTDSIERVRNEQKGMELSVGGHSDESSMFQVPGPTPMRGDLHSVRKLVDSIEAVHNQLAKTIDESQRIIGVKQTSEQSSKSTSSSTRPTALTETDENSPIYSSTSVDGQYSANNSRQELSGRGIPKIISSERVNISLSRFKTSPKPQTGHEITGRKSTSPSRRKSPRQEEDVVERLSKEILEQSKALDNIMSEISPKKTDFDDSRSHHVSDSSPPRGKSPSPKKRQDFSPKSQDQSEIRDGIFAASGSKQEQDSDFVPLLAGIPKVQRMLPNTFENRRPRPPVTLIHGPHRVQTGSPGHELSTIVEFDTPDTASKSQKSMRSPVTGKSRKNLVQNYQNPTGKPTTSPPTRSRTPVDPSSPLAQARTPESPNKRSGPSPTTQTNAKQNSFRAAGTSGSCDLEKKCEAICPKSGGKSPQKSVEVSGTQTDNNGLLKKEGSSDSSCSIPDISAEFTRRNLIFHARMVTAETSTSFRPKESRKQITSVSTEADKEKITSTSSNSFSGLSGISEITSTPTSDILKYTSSPEEMETALKKLGLGWAITTLKKTREASALSSSSNSDTTPINPSRKLISPAVKTEIESKINCLPDLSDVSSISIKDANKSTERAILLKARTSTPNIEQSNTSCEKNSSSTTTTNSSRVSLQDQSDSLTAPNLSLTTKKSPYDKQLNGA